MSTLSETIKLIVLGLILAFEWVVRTCLTTFYRWFPFPTLLDILYQRLSFLRATFSSRLAGPVDRPEFKFCFRDFVLQHGYDVEEHYADTPDGFCLLLHRVLPKQVSKTHPRHHQRQTRTITTSRSPDPDGVTESFPLINTEHEVLAAPLQNVSCGLVDSNNDCTAALDASPIDTKPLDRFLSSDPLSPTRYYCTVDQINSTKKIDVSNDPSPSLLCSVDRVYRRPTHSYSLTSHRDEDDDRSSMCSYNTSLSKRRRPIFLMHGLMMSSDVFVIDRSISLPLLLVDAGYDVWVGNNRGNKYSWIHKFYKRNTEQYWDFSIDELARYDVPTSINYILKFTKFQSLAYLGFSNGAAQMFAALSTNASLNRLVDVFIALAPACKLETLNPECSTFSLFYPLVTSSRIVFMRIFGCRAMLSVTEAWKNILSTALFTKLVDLALLSLFSWRLTNVKSDTRELFYAHLYSTTSTKVVHHWFQMLRSGCFEFYNDSAGGMSDVVAVPEYCLQKLRVPVAIIHGGKDKLSDVSWMRHRLRECECWPVSSYEHVDPLVSRDVPEIVFPIVLDILKRQYPCSFIHASKMLVDTDGGSGCLVDRENETSHRNDDDDGENNSFRDRSKRNTNKKVKGSNTVANQKHLNGNGFEMMSSGHKKCEGSLPSLLMSMKKRLTRRHSENQSSIERKTSGSLGAKDIHERIKRKLDGHESSQHRRKRCRCNEFNGMDIGKYREDDENCSMVNGIGMSQRHYSTATTRTTSLSKPAVETSENMKANSSELDVLNCEESCSESGISDGDNLCLASQYPIDSKADLSTGVAQAEESWINWGLICFMVFIAILSCVLSPTLDQLLELI